MSPQILEVLQTVGMQISAGQLSDLLIKRQDVFHAQSAAVVRAGLGSSPWQHLDSTGTRVNGSNQHCHVLCNPLYSFYCTTPSKDRLSMLRVLLGGAELGFHFNAKALELMEQLGVSPLWGALLTYHLGEEHAFTQARFDQLFTVSSGYQQLDEYKQRTRNKREQVLLVLSHPEILLHNNPAELGARQRVRKRDVSLQARTHEGIEAWDTFQTLVATAKKLGVNLFSYFFDRITQTFALPSLAARISQRAASLALGSSWKLAP